LHDACQTGYGLRGARSGRETVAELMTGVVASGPVPSARRAYMTLCTLRSGIPFERPGGAATVQEVASWSKCGVAPGAVGCTLSGISLLITHHSAVSVAVGLVAVGFAVGGVVTLLILVRSGNASDAR
jgi:hypothetical protein